MPEGESKSGLSRRISGGVGRSKARGQPLISRLASGAVLLHGLSVVMSLPVISGLLSGRFGLTLGSAMAFACMLLAARLMRRGLLAEHDFQARRVAKAPMPFKLAGHLAVTIAVFILAWTGGDSGLPMSMLYACLAGVGSYLTYGADPRGDKNVDPKLAARAGIDTQSVIDALNEAEGKLFEIEEHARELKNRELVKRLGNIVASGRRILDQIEKDPSDIRRARRFLVTYLDGTRNVVSGYRAQQLDLANTEISTNFDHVLTTVERVFGEQETVLKQNETLDLEVQIDVLRTQMEREGVN